MSATEQDLVEPESEVSAVAETSPSPEEAEAVTSEDEMDRLDPIPTTYTFEDGLEVDVERLATRQFFKLLRIVTRGGVDVLQAVRLDPTQGVDVFTENLIALIIFAVPEAEDETIEFLRSMVKPKQVAIPDDTPPGDVGKVAKTLEAQSRRALDAEFRNPGLDDLFGLIEVVIRREAPELKALGKRLADTLKFNQTVKATDDGASSPTVQSLEALQEPST
jgi:hypothetical protein